MIRHLYFNDDALTQHALDIQKRAYRIEADLIDFDGIPHLHETIDDLRNSKETFIGYFMDGALAGMISYEIEDKVLDIGRVVIDPDYFRRGIGRALVEQVSQVANISKWIVATGAKNHPARKLYESLGYHLVEEITLPVGVTIARYQKMRSD